MFLLEIFTLISVNKLNMSYYSALHDRDACLRSRGYTFIKTLTVRNFSKLMIWIRSFICQKINYEEV